MRTVDSDGNVCYSKDVGWLTDRTTLSDSRARAYALRPVGCRSDAGRMPGHYPTVMNCKVMLDNIKRMSFRAKWNLREVHKVTQYKEGCIYRTKSLGMIICLSEYQLLNMKDIQIGPISTRITRELI